jgi:formate transporter
MLEMQRQSPCAATPKTPGVVMDNRNSQQGPAVSVDPFAPREIATRLEAASVLRASLPARTLILLGLLGGLYIGFGGALATLVLTDNALGFGLGRFVAGLSFSLGLIMLVVAGGELFTGNNLMVLAYATGRIFSLALLRNWGIVFAANAAGAILLALAIHASGILDGNAVKATAVKIAETKAQLGMAPAFVRGVLCNMLVCLAVWLSVGARSVEGKVVAIALPIGAFVALGFEHCIANLYLLPIGMLSGAQIGFGDVVGNLLPVTLGNMLGGVLVAVAYYFVYLSQERPQEAQRASPEPEAHAAQLWRVSAIAGWPAIAPPEVGLAANASPPPVEASFQPVITRRGKHRVFAEPAGQGVPSVDDSEGSVAARGCPAQRDGGPRYRKSDEPRRHLKS